MSEWKKVKIGDFLTEREGRYKPDDSKISKYKRLDKIDFSGTIHISDKPTKTDMIIVHLGDLVISGINVAKGAVAVYQGDEPVCATIHYSSYTFDSSKVDLEYFKYFVKSPAFIAALQKQVKGGIKTEIKPRHLLPLEISIPDLQTQQEIVKKISLQLKKTEQLSVEIESQKNYIKQLRQNILQEAIEGKLTIDWRKQNTVQKGNPDYDAEALFEKIQKERNSEKKQKELSPITDEEKPFEIPEGWKWVQLGEVAEILGGYAYKSYDFQTEGKNLVLRLGNIRTGFLRYEASPAFISDELASETHDFKVLENDILVTMTGTRGKKDYLYILRITKEHISRYDMFLNQRLASIRLYFDSNYGYLTLENEGLKEPIFNSATGSANQANIGMGALQDWLIPLPPLAEQKEIVARVEQLLQTVAALEAQIAEREQLTKTLFQSILKEAFEEE